MNERIREIAEQAGITPGVMGLNRFTYFDPEKFAELILQDCLNTCAAYADCYGVAQTIAKHLRSDFGIEERNT